MEILKTKVNSFIGLKNVKNAFKPYNIHYYVKIGIKRYGKLFKIYFQNLFMLKYRPKF